MYKILFSVILLFQQYNGLCINSSITFTAEYDPGAKLVTLKWEHRFSETGTYVIQHSRDNKNWEDIGLQGINLNMKARSCKFSDSKPTAGLNYYRIKFIAVNGKTDVSQAIMVSVTLFLKNWVMYPVPVKDMLTLEYRGSEKITGVINIFIQRNSGQIITRLRNSSLSKAIQIPVDNLGRGIYDIRIIIGGEVVWYQQFIK